MLLIISHILIERKLFSRILCDGILMCSTALVHNHLISFVLLCYEETLFLHLVLFVYFPNVCSYFLFQVYLILGCCFKCFLPSTFISLSFPLFLFFPPLWYISSFLKWIPSCFVDGLSDPLISEPAEPLSLFHSAASFSLVLTDWMPLDYFPSSTWYLCISLSFQVTFLIFSVDALPRCQTFFGLHSYFSLISSGICQGTLTFSPIPNLSQILKPHAIGVIDDTVMTQLCDFPETLGR